MKNLWQGQIKLLNQNTKIMSLFLLTKTWSLYLFTYVNDARSIFKLIKYIPHKEDLTPIYLLIKHPLLSGFKYFSRWLNMRFALV